MLLVISFGSMSITAGRLAVPALLPTIIETYGVSPAVAGYAVTATVVAFGLSQYPGGRLSDELSHRTVLVAAAGLFSVGFAVLSLSPTFLTLLAGAAVVGVANGLYLPASLAEISARFSARRGRAFGVNAGSFQLGSAIGPGLATVALALGWWRFAFVPVVVLFAAVLVLFHRWSTDPYTLAPVPTLDVRATLGRLSGSRTARRTALAFVVFGFVFQGGINFLPTFMQVSRGFSPTVASAVFAAVFLLSVVVNPAVGAAGDRVGHPRVAAAGALVGLAGLATFVTGTSVAATVAGVLAFGVGVSAFWPPMDAFVMSRLPDESAAGDFGVLNTFNLAGGSLGPVYVGVVAERAGYAAALAGLAVPILLTVVVLLAGLSGRE
jgi:MFS family permease